MYVDVQSAAVPLYVPACVTEGWMNARSTHTIRVLQVQIDV